MLLERTRLGGEKGIRTLGELPHTDFPGLPIKPLSHLSIYYKLTLFDN